MDGELLSATGICAPGRMFRKQNLYLRSDRRYLDHKLSLEGKIGSGNSELPFRGASQAFLEHLPPSDYRAVWNRKQ